MTKNSYKYLLSVALIVFSFGVMATPTTTCTNSCVITHNPDGSVSIRDCCGGRVITTFPPNAEV
jgi:hypothetical protein